MSEVEDIIDGAVEKGKEIVANSNPNDALAIQEEMPDLTLSPEEAKKFISVGRETQKQLVIPQLVIVQALSTDIKKSFGVSDGVIFNSVTKQSYDGVKLIPLFVKYGRKRKDKKVTLCFSPDGEWGIGNPGDANKVNNISCYDCPCQKWLTEQQKLAIYQAGNKPPKRPECADVFRWYFKFVEPDIIPFCYISFSISSIQLARNFNTVATKGLTSKPYWGQFAFVARPDKNSEGQDYFNWEYQFYNGNNPQEVKEAGLMAQNLLSLLSKEDVSIFKDDAIETEGEEQNPF